MRNKTFKILLTAITALLVLIAAILVVVQQEGHGFDNTYVTDNNQNVDIIEEGGLETQKGTDTAEEGTTPPTESETEAGTEKEEKVYAIYYIGLEGADHSNPTIYTVATAAQVELESPSARPGYQFVGWYIGDVCVTSLAGLTGDLTLMAKWIDQEECPTVPTEPETEVETEPEEKVYTIYYNGLEGTDHSNPTTYTASTAAQVVLESPSARPGYQFDGWYMRDTLVTSLAGLTGDLTLTAKWIQESTEGIELPVIPF